MTRHFRTKAVIMLTFEDGRGTSDYLMDIGSLLWLREGSIWAFGTDGLWHETICVPELINDWLTEGRIEEAP